MAAGFQRWREGTATAASSSEPMVAAEVRTAYSSDETVSDVATTRCWPLIGVEATGRLGVRPVDVRVVVATHQDLDRLCEEGRFRPDLRARLVGARLQLPGLAERRTEILPLLRGFLGSPPAALTTAAAEALLVYGWPYNVRELKPAA